MGGGRSFPPKRRVNVRFVGLTGFRCITERQKPGLVSNGFTSCVSALMRSSRLIYLSYDLVHGNIHTSAKAQAIMLGDVSGTVIPPFFVYYAELSGRHEYQLSRMEFSLWGSQGVLGQLTFRSLSMIRQEHDPFTFAQAHWTIALALMVIGNPDLAWKHYRRAITVVKRHNIRFSPLVNAHHPETPSITTGLIPSEEDHERVAFLAKILYLEAFLYFYISGLPGTKVWANRDHEDRLPVWMQMFPWCILWA